MLKVIFLLICQETGAKTTCSPLVKMAAGLATASPTIATSDTSRDSQPAEKIARHPFFVLILRIHRTGSFDSNCFSSSTAWRVLPRARRSVQRARRRYCHDNLKADLLPFHSIPPSQTSPLSPPLTRFPFSLLSPSLLFELCIDSHNHVAEIAVRRRRNQTEGWCGRGCVVFILWYQPGWRPLLSESLVELCSLELMPGQTATPLVWLVDS